MYVVERWLARLSASQYADQFVLKGGMLLAAYDARRPTVDVDGLALKLDNSVRSIANWVVDVAEHPVAPDGVEFLTATVQARPIRESAMYSGVRVGMDTRIATATVKLRIDINVGDPVTPAPQTVELPALRSNTPPVQLLGYPIETVLAEKLVTAIGLGPANTRVRDFADVYTLTGRHDLEYETAWSALQATAAFRGVEIERLSTAIEDLAERRRSAYLAYRNRLGPYGLDLPADLAGLTAAVTTYADPLADPPRAATWRASLRRWVTRE